jgi:hypothetical protein
MLLKGASSALDKRTRYFSSEGIVTIKTSGLTRGSPFPSRGLMMPSLSLAFQFDVFILSARPVPKIDNLVKSRCAPFYSAGKGFPSPAI